MTAVDSLATALVPDERILVDRAIARRGYLLAKRCLDVLVALSMLVALLPLMAVVALAIVVDSGRPVLFRQERVGARLHRTPDGWRWRMTTFRMWKFRTMVPEAERSGLHREFVTAFVAGRVEAGRDAGTPFKLAADPRVTAVGRRLRATSLDELPQLLNVLAGSMSLVGPRPVPTYEVAAYEARHLARLAGKPGITGPWQVEGRGSASFEEMVDMDVSYLTTQSLARDVGLLVRTVPCVLLRKGAR